MLGPSGGQCVRVEVEAPEAVQVIVGGLTDERRCLRVDYHVWARAGGYVTGEAVIRSLSGTSWAGPEPHRASSGCTCST